MLLYVLKENKNAKMPEANGKFYAYPVITQTKDIDGLAEHMANHNTPFSKGAIKGMITDMVTCVKELTLQGIAVKIDDLAIFSIGIKNKEGAASEKEFSVQKNVDGFKLRARGTGEFRANNLDVELKKATSLVGAIVIPDDDEEEDNNPSTPSQGGGSSSGGSDNPGGSTTGDGGGSSTGGSDGDVTL